MLLTAGYYYLPLLPCPLFLPCGHNGFPAGECFVRALFRDSAFTRFFVVVLHRLQSSLAKRSAVEYGREKSFQKGNCPTWQ